MEITFIINISIIINSSRFFSISTIVIFHGLSSFHIYQHLSAFVMIYHDLSSFLMSSICLMFLHGPAEIVKPNLSFPPPESSIIHPILIHFTCVSLPQQRFAARTKGGKGEAARCLQNSDLGKSGGNQGWSWCFTRMWLKQCHWHHRPVITMSNHWKYVVCLPFPVVGHPPESLTTTNLPKQRVTCPNLLCSEDKKQVQTKLWNKLKGPV